MTKSIVQTGEKQCYLCGRQRDLQCHHILAGVANRKLSDKYGLWVWLCASCHTGVDGAQYNSNIGNELKQKAQQEFEEKYSHDLWMKTFRKNYI